MHVFNGRVVIALLYTKQIADMKFLSVLGVDWFFENCFEHNIILLIYGLTKEESLHLSIRSYVFTVLLMKFVEIALTLSIETYVTKHKGATNGYMEVKLNNTSIVKSMRKIK